MSRFAKIAVAALFVFLAQFHPGAMAQEAGKVRDIDVVICLDVSGSMNGLVLQAKNKLWDIVNELARVKPTPNLRVALYSYGHTSYDAKVGWIRKDLDLTTDLDALYEKLFALTIRGGTELVTRVCRDAVRDLNWSKDPQALKLIFVCGNEPASQDKVVSLKEAADFAISKGVIINPIFCGNPEHKDAVDWKEFAKLCGGRFAAINQNKGHVAVATPFDKQLGELSVKMNATYVSYGKEGAQKAAAQKGVTALAKKQGDGVAAARAMSQNSGLYQGKNASWDLVDQLKADPKFDVAKVPDADLCEDLKKLKPAERAGYVQQMAAKRETLQKEITALDKQRQAYIAAEMKKTARPADAAFDAAISETLRIQAAGKGIIIPKD